MALKIEDIESLLKFEYTTVEEDKGEIGSIKDFADKIGKERETELSIFNIRTDFVRKHLGGSPDKIKNLINELREKINNEKLTSVSVTTIPDAPSELINSIWRDAYNKVQHLTSSRLDTLVIKNENLARNAESDKVEIEDLYVIIKKNEEKLSLQEEKMLVIQDDNDKLKESDTDFIDELENKNKENEEYIKEINSIQLINNNNKEEIEALKLKLKSVEKELDTSKESQKVLQDSFEKTTDKLNEKVSFLLSINNNEVIKVGIERGVEEELKKKE